MPKKKFKQQLTVETAFDLFGDLSAAATRHVEGSVDDQDLREAARAYVHYCDKLEAKS
jgi:hypothetical protein